MKKTFYTFIIVLLSMQVSAQFYYKIKLKDGYCLGNSQIDSLFTDGDLDGFISQYTPSLNGKIVLLLKLDESYERRIAVYKFFGIKIQGDENHDLEKILLTIWLKQRIFIYYMDEFSFRTCYEKIYPIMLQIPLIRSSHASP